MLSRVSLTSNPQNTTQEDKTKFKRFMHVPPIYFKPPFEVRSLQVKPKFEKYKFHWIIFLPFSCLMSIENPSFSCAHWVEESTSFAEWIAAGQRIAKPLRHRNVSYCYNLLTSSRHFLPMQCFRWDVHFLTSNQHDGKARLCLIQFNLGQKTRG